MLAVVQQRYGSPDDLVLREIDRPEIGPGQVLVRMRAASVHPDVWHMVSGRPYLLRLMGAGLLRPSNPVPGTDLAGVVEEVGADVTGFEPGDAVFGETIETDRWAHGGAFAEYVAVDQELLVLKPACVSFAQAAAVPTSGFIALLNLRDPCCIRPGQRVLINGAAGGVGSLALQIAKARGAHVTAVDRGCKLHMLRAMGADEVVDGAEEDFTQRGVRYELVFDVPGNHSLSACRRALAADGRYVLIGHEGFGASGKPVFGLIPRFVKLMLLSRFLRQLRGPAMGVPTREAAMTIVRDYLASGAIRPIIDSTYPLSRAREALWHMIRDDTLGKVIIVSGEEE